MIIFIRCLDSFKCDRREQNAKLSYKMPATLTVKANKCFNDIYKYQIIHLQTDLNHKDMEDIFYTL
jgi:hypothetical protein